PTIAKTISLLELPEDVHHMVRNGALTASHGAALARFRAYPAVASRIAKMAVEQQVTSHQLERRGIEGLHAAWQLQQEGLVQRIGKYGTEFDTSICKRCPFDANAGGYCLNPKHYNELQADARKQKQAEAQRAMQKIREKGDQVLKLEKLQWRQYEDLRYGQPPEGCGEECPCSAQALDRDGTTLMPICTDPARYRQLKAKQTRAENAEKREQHKRALADLEGRMDGLQGTGSRELALIVANALGSVGGQIAMQALKRHAPGLLGEEGKVNRWGLPGPDTLAELDSAALVRLGMEVLLRGELHDRYNGYATGTPRLDWYTGDAKNRKRGEKYPPWRVWERRPLGAPHTQH
ncbi:MAG: hypothetical protein M3Q29_05080, partial [Chloroflexota bacterium]|nr:hypothetical protein [Chloroflexota bacterium]